eukprot:186342_1
MWGSSELHKEESNSRKASHFAFGGSRPNSPSHKTNTGRTKHGSLSLSRSYNNLHPFQIQKHHQNGKINHKKNMSISNSLNNHHPQTVKLKVSNKHKLQFNVPSLYMDNAPELISTKSLLISSSPQQHLAYNESYDDDEKTTTNH